jgi:TolA-binding protein
MKKNAPRFGRTGELTLYFWLVLGLVFMAGCGQGGSDVAYDAEKALYEARKLRSELSTQWIIAGTDFLNRTLESYRNLVEAYSDQMYQVDGLELIVVSGQMDLAEILFQASMLPEARAEFEKAFGLAKNVPEARIAALYSTAHLSEQLEERDRAIHLFEQFHELFLGPEQVEGTVEINSQYMIVPLKLAELYQMVENNSAEKDWLKKAELFYRELVGRLENPELVKTARYNHLATTLQAREWEKGLEMLREFLDLFANDEDRGALLFLEAKVYQDGLNQPRQAFNLFKKLHADHPDLPQASSALLSAAALAKKLKRTAESEQLYKQVVAEYPNTPSVTAEAQWQLAGFEEERGNWVEASARYQKLSKEHPTTVQGLEAPMKIAQNFQKDKETDAVRAVLQRALRSYEKLLTYHYPLPTKIIIEQYVIRTLIELERWPEAIDRLLALPDRYSGYRRFQMNYLTAASIQEEQLNDVSAATVTLSQCIQRFPGTQAAVAAEAQLKRLQGTK